MKTKFLAPLFFLILFSCEEMPAKEITIDESRTQIAVTPKEEIEPEIVIQKTVPVQKVFLSNFGEIEVEVKQKDNRLQYYEHVNNHKNG